MEFESFEPDPSDEYYNELCQFLYATMFNGGGYSADCNVDYSLSLCDAVAC